LQRFHSPLEAKQFFIGKVLEQAEAERLELSEPEKKMLYFTETGNDACPEYLAAVERFDREHDSKPYEAKIAGLLRRAYDRELKQAKQIGQEKDIRQAYRSAYEVFRQEDHYLQVMIDLTWQSRLRKKWLGLF
jgi:hypothetical protein